MSMEIVNVQFFVSTNDYLKKYRCFVVVEGPSKRDEIYFSPELVKQLMEGCIALEEKGYTPVTGVPST